MSDPAAEDEADRRIVAPEPLDLDVDIAVRSLNGSQGQGWAVAARRRKAERLATIAALDGFERPDWPRYHVLIERYGAQRMDDDGAISAMKAPRDAIAQYLGLNDADSRVTWTVRQVIRREKDDRFFAKRGSYRTWIRVVVSPVPIPAEPGDVDSAAPDREDRKILPSTKRARPVSPEAVGGVLLREVELPPRGGSSRLVAQLRRLEKPSGRGVGLKAGDAYVRISQFWESAGVPWRSAGSTVRISELRALAAALLELEAEALR